MQAGFATPQRITLSEVAEHRKKDDAWSVFHGKVYNITPYMDFHPGGASQLMKCAGKDGTELFSRLNTPHCKWPVLTPCSRSEDARLGQCRAHDGRLHDWLASQRATDAVAYIHRHHQHVTSVCVRHVVVSLWSELLGNGRHRSALSPVSFGPNDKTARNVGSRLMECEYCGRSV